jgi:hypothetical protein
MKIHGVLVFELMRLSLPRAGFPSFILGVVQFQRGLVVECRDERYDGLLEVYPNSLNRRSQLVITSNTRNGQNLLKRDFIFSFAPRGEKGGDWALGHLMGYGVGSMKKKVGGFDAEKSNVFLLPLQNSPLPLRNSG